MAITIGGVQQRPISNVRARAVNFSSGDAQQLAKLGQTAVNELTALQAKIDRTQVRDALNAYDSSMVAFTQNEYNNVQADAVGSTERVSKESAEAQKKAVKNFKLSNTGTELFRANAATSERSYVKNMGGHERNQVEAYDIATTEAQQKIATNKAIQNRNNDTYIGEILTNTILPNSIKLAKKKHGEDADKDVISAYAQGMTDTYLGSIIDATADADSVTKAYDMLQRYGNLMSPELRATKEAQLKGGSEAEITRGKSFELSKSGMTITDQLDAIESLTYTVNGEEKPLTADMKDGVRRRVKQLDSDKKTYKAAAQKEFYESEGDRVATMSPEDLAEYKIPRNKLSIAQADKIEDIARNNALRGANNTLGKSNTISEAEAYGKFLDLSIEDKKKYDITGNMTKLGKPYYDSAVREIRSLRDTGEATDKGRSYDQAKLYINTMSAFKIYKDDSDKVQKEKAKLKGQFTEQWEAAWNSLSPEKKTQDPGLELVNRLLTPAESGSSGVDYRFQAAYSENLDAIFEDNRPEWVPRDFKYDKEDNKYYSDTGNVVVVIDPFTGIKEYFTKPNGETAIKSDPDLTPLAPVAEETPKQPKEKTKEKKKTPVVSFPLAKEFLNL